MHKSNMSLETQYLNTVELNWLKVTTEVVKADVPKTKIADLDKVSYFQLPILT
jgi:hypothetical protein